MPENIGTPALWIGFGVFVLLMLALDLGVFHRQAHEVSYREALAWSLAWITLALLFNAGIYHWFGRRAALEFLAGYVIEKSLSVDNIFVFVLIFSYFSVQRMYQHRILYWGILGALLMRAAFILAGAVLLETFHWIIYVFGAFLIFTGIRMLKGAEMEVHPERNPVLRVFQRLVPVDINYTGQRLIVRKEGRRYATPLLLVLVMVEATDVVFAVDSIPAIFAVTRDPFLVFTSNIFAILGLRALYFLLAGAIQQFSYLKFGLGLVLAFVGVKMSISGYLHIPIGLSLAVVALVLGGSIALSFLRRPPPDAPAVPAEQDPPPARPQELPSPSDP